MLPFGRVGRPDGGGGEQKDGVGSGAATRSVASAAAAMLRLCD